MKSIFILIFLAFTLSSCNTRNDTETVSVDGRYSLDLSTSFTKTRELNADASMQYMDGLRELYVVVIDEPKDAITKAIVDNGLENTYSPDLKGYSKLILDSMLTKVKTDTLTSSQDTKIGSLNAIKTDFSGNIEGTNIYYKIAFVEGKNRYYQIMTWTLADRRQTHEAEMQDIIDSFKETDRSAAK